MEVCWLCHPSFSHSPQSTDLTTSLSHFSHRSLLPIAEALSNDTATPALVLSHESDPNWLDLCDALPRCTRLRHLDVRSSLLVHSRSVADSISRSRHLRRLMILGTTRSLDGLFVFDLCRSLSLNASSSRLQSLSIQAIETLDDPLANALAETLPLLPQLVALELLCKEVKESAIEILLAALCASSVKLLHLSAFHLELFQQRE